MRPKERIKPFLRYIEREWLRNPDYRFGQLLINLGLVNHNLDTWNNEIEDYSLPFEIQRQVTFWGKYKGHYVDRALGPVPIYKQIAISKLETNHIKNILRTQKQIKDTYMERILKEELRYRKINIEQKTKKSTR